MSLGGREGGGARSLKGARREGEIPRDLAPGGEITMGGGGGGEKSPGHLLLESGLNLTQG